MIGIRMARYLRRMIACGNTREYRVASILDDRCLSRQQLRETETG